MVPGRCRCHPGSDKALPVSPPEVARLWRGGTGVPAGSDGIHRGVLVSPPEVTHTRFRSRLSFPQQRGRGCARCGTGVGPGLGVGALDPGRGRGIPGWGVEYGITAWDPTAGGWIPEWELEPR